MPDTLTREERLEAAAELQSMLAAHPEAETIGLAMDRADTVRMINTLRGHDLLNLGDVIQNAFGLAGGELASVVDDVIDRMDVDEYDEVVEHARNALLGAETPVDDGIPVEALMRGVELLAARYGLVLDRNPVAAEKYNPQIALYQELVENFIHSLGSEATGGDPGDETVVVDKNATGYGKVPERPAGPAACCGAMVVKGEHVPRFYRNGVEITRAAFEAETGISHAELVERLQQQLRA